jgi:hypothetical protein
VPHDDALSTAFLALAQVPCGAGCNVRLLPGDPAAVLPQGDRSILSAMAPLSSVQLGRAVKEGS